MKLCEVEWKGMPALVVEEAFGEPAAGCWTACVVMVLIFFRNGLEVFGCCFAISLFAVRRSVN